jgi:hypothetical protein
VIRCKNNPPYLHGVGRKLNTEKERYKERNKERKIDK